MSGTPSRVLSLAGSAVEGESCLAYRVMGLLHNTMKFIRLVSNSYDK